MINEFEFSMCSELGLLPPWIDATKAGMYEATPMKNDFTYSQLQEDDDDFFEVSSIRSPYKKALLEHQRS